MTSIKPLIDYLIQFHCHQDYFECHEILEDHWKNEGMNNKIWVGFIQLAVSLYHYRRNNLSGAKKLMAKATDILKSEHTQINQFGFDSEKLISILEETKQKISHNIPYQPIVLPLKKESSLFAAYRHQCEQIGLSEMNEHDKANAFIVHKHLLRDRSEVIRERKLAILEKQSQA